MISLDSTDHFFLTFLELELEVSVLRERTNEVIGLVRTQGANRAKHLLDVPNRFVKPFVATLIVLLPVPWLLSSLGQVTSYSTSPSC